MKPRVRVQLTLKYAIANMNTNRKSQALVRIWGNWLIVYCYEWKVIKPWKTLQQVSRS